MITLLVTDNGSKGTEIAIPAPMEAPIASYIESQLLDGAPKYANFEALLVEAVNDLLTRISLAFPPQTVADAKEAVKQAEAALDLEKSSSVLIAAKEAAVNGAIIN